MDGEAIEARARGLLNDEVPLSISSTWDESEKRCIVRAIIAAITSGREEIVRETGWHPRIGDEVRVTEHVPDWPAWRENRMFVVGVQAERGKEGLNITVSEDCPLGYRGDGFTDGFWINRPFKPDDLEPVRALAPPRTSVPDTEEVGA